VVVLVVELVSAIVRSALGGVIREPLALLRSVRLRMNFSWQVFREEYLVRRVQSLQ
jgi:hypothetical protein